MILTNLVYIYSRIKNDASFCLIQTVLPQSELQKLIKYMRIPFETLLLRIECTNSAAKQNEDIQDRPLK